MLSRQTDVGHSLSLYILPALRYAALSTDAHFTRNFANSAFVPLLSFFPSLEFG